MKNDDYGVVDMLESYTPEDVYKIMTKEGVVFKEFIDEDEDENKSFCV